MNQLWNRCLAILMLIGLIASAAAPRAQARPLEEPLAPSAPGQAALAPVVSTSVINDTSPPLKTLVGKPLAPDAEAPELRLRPHVRTNRPAGGNAADGAIDRGPQGPDAMPATIANFDGVDNIADVHPPDTVGDVGPNHYMQWVNLYFAIWDKSGTLLYGPEAGNTLWTDFGGICEANNDGDPIVLYDQLADRWMVSQFALGFPNNFHECIAVSATGDPLGAWHRYDFLYSTTKMNDYPHFGIWPDGYYATYNQFGGPPTYPWKGAGVVSYEREKMLLGQPARQIYFDLESVNDAFNGMLPADVDGPPPPAGAPALFMEADDSTFFAGLPADRLAIWEFRPNWANPASSTFGLSGQPNYSLPVAEFNAEVCAEFARACIPQKDTTSKLDAISDRVMHRVQYRNFGAHQSLVLNHTVDAGGDQAAPRWYELRDSGAGWGVHQQATFAPDATNRWMGSIAMDGAGNIALGYSASSAAIFPDIRYAGRLAGDPLNSLAQGEATLMAGAGSQTSAFSRWGDYSSMNVDPVDDCTFWYTQEYYAATSYSDWSTRIGSFKFPGCDAAQSGSLAGKVTVAGSAAPLANVSIKAGAYSTLTDQQGRYRINTIATGAYTVTASLYGYTVDTASVTISEAVTATQDFVLEARPSAVISGQVRESATGLPLYARLSIAELPQAGLFSDPVTGAYTVSLLIGETYSFNVTAVAPNHQAAARSVTVGATPPPVDFEIEVDAALCSVPGYAPSITERLNETFDADTTPAGWTITDGKGNGQVWVFNNPGNRINLTGGSGGFAILDSDDYGSGNQQESGLSTPALDFSGQDTVLLEFATDYRQGDSRVQIDVSTDGGSAWTPVWSKATSYRGPVTEKVDLSAVAGNQASVQIRFAYTGMYAWWWQIDNVRVFSQSCDSSVTSHLVGYIYDENTGAPMVGANAWTPGAGVSSMATPADPRVGDGLYILPIQGAGTKPVFSATSVKGYGMDTDTLTFAAGGTLTHDFALPAAFLSVAESVSVTVPVSGTAIESLVISNTGALSTALDLLEINAVYSPTLEPTGPFASAGRVVGPKALLDLNGRSIRDYKPPVAPELAAGATISQFPVGLDYGWGLGYDTNANSIWISNMEAEGGDNLMYEFLPDGTKTGETIDTNDWVAAFGADMAYNPVSQSMWQVNVGGDNCIHEHDLAAKAATGTAICPSFGTSERGLAFDPLSGSYYAGSWTDLTLKHFNADGTILDSKRVGIAIAGLAYNPATGHLFASASFDASGPGHDIYVLDTRNDYAVIGAFFLEAEIAGGAASLDIDCEGDLWLIDQNTQTVYEVESGESGVCDWQDIPWLTVTPTSGAVAGGGSQAVTLTFDAAGLAVGRYEAYLSIGNSTPYGAQPVRVVLTVALDEDGNKIYLPAIYR